MNNNIIEKRIKLKNITLNVAIAGDENGKVILLLHGYPDAWFGWEKIILLLINQGYRVIAPDQRGYNLSDKPEGVQSYYTENIVQDALHLMSHLGYANFYLAGHDYGAYIAWIIALKHQERVKKLMIMGGLHPTVLQNIKKVSWSQLIKSWYLLFFRIKKIPEKLLSHKNFLFLHSNHSASLTAKEKERYTLAWSQPNAVESMINWYRSTPTFVENSYLQMPVFLIWGEKDLYLTVKAAEHCLDYCLEGQLKVIKNASHWLMLEETETVVKEMTAFFD